MKQQHQEIKRLEQLVVNLVDSKGRAAADQQMAVRLGRAKMGALGSREAAPAYAGILKAAAASEMQGLRGQLPGVNVGDWFDSRAEKTSEDQMLARNGRLGDRSQPTSQYSDVPGMMSADEKKKNAKTRDAKRHCAAAAVFRRLPLLPALQRGYRVVHLGHVRGG